MKHGQQLTASDLAAARSFCEMIGTWPGPITRFDEGPDAEPSFVENPPNPRPLAPARQYEDV